jgi:hypothetical protein
VCIFAGMKMATACMNTVIDVNSRDKNAHFNKPNYNYPEKAHLNTNLYMLQGLKKTVTFSTVFFSVLLANKRRKDELYEYKPVI